MVRVRELGWLGETIWTNQFTYQKWSLTKVRQKEATVHSPCLVRRWCPRQRAWTWSHTVALSCGTTMIYRCPGGQEQTQSKKGLHTLGTLQHPGLHHATPTRRFYSNGQSALATNKNPVKINHCSSQKKQAIIIAFCFFPQYNDNNGWWRVGTPATAGWGPDCIWQTARKTWFTKASNVELLLVCWWFELC